MATFFHIIQQPHGNWLHLKLAGHFDGSSAFELIDELERAARHYRRISIDTTALIVTATFGLDVFGKNLDPVKQWRTRLRFTGGNASDFSEIVPAWMQA